MEPLFTTDIIIEGQNKLFNVFFSEEAYHFEPEDNEGQSFTARREADEWKLTGAVAPIARQQAVDALDRYLLSQH